MDDIARTCEQLRVYLDLRTYRDAVGSTKSPSVMGTKTSSMSATTSISACSRRGYVQRVSDDEYNGLYCIVLKDYRNGASY